MYGYINATVDEYVEIKKFPAEKDSNDFRL